MEFLPIIKGKIWNLGDNIDTDIIVPSRVLTEQNKEKLLAATLELVYPNFAQEVKLGDILIGGYNFGCGSSREEAVYVLKELGIRSIIARSFARIFYRNCINLGLPPIIYDGKENIGANEEFLEINLEQGKILNIDQKLQYNFQAFPSLIFRYLKAGGAFGLLKDQR